MKTRADAVVTQVNKVAAIATALHDLRDDLIHDVNQLLEYVEQLESKSGSEEE